MPNGSAPGMVLRECLHAAIAAPSVHNTQPWLFRVWPGGVDIYADRARALPVIDPRGRELLISVGAAAFNLRVSVLARGRMPVQELLPDPRNPDLAVRITVGPHTAVPETARRLAQAIPHRHTNRRPFSNVLVPSFVHSELADAAAAETGTLIVTGQQTRETVLGVVRTAENRWRNDPAYWRELKMWTSDQPERCDGIPTAAFGPWSALEMVPLRDFGLVQPARGRYATDFEQPPTIAVLYTDRDTPEHWLRAGQALERLLLTATVRGVATTLMTQPMEIPELRALLANAPDGKIAQAVLRLGYGTPGTPSPRRNVDECLVRTRAPGQGAPGQGALGQGALGPGLPRQGVPGPRAAEPGVAGSTARV